MTSKELAATMMAASAKCHMYLIQTTSSLVCGCMMTIWGISWTSVHACVIVGQFL